MFCGRGGEGGVPCWEPVANYSAPAGGTPLHPPPSHPGNPQGGRSGVALWIGSHSPPIEAVASRSAPSLSSLSRLHIQFPAHSPSTFHHLIFNLRTPSYSSRAPTCYDDASLPIATAHQMLCLTCVQVHRFANGSGCRSHLHSNNGDLAQIGTDPGAVLITSQLSHRAPPHQLRYRQRTY